MGSELVSTLLLSGVIGLALGVFGGGGSILAVPVLVLVAHLTPAGAVATSLAIVGTTSLVASYSQYRRGLVKPKDGLTFGLSGVLTSLLGAKLTGLVSGASIMHAFGALMLVVGVSLPKALTKLRVNTLVREVLLREPELERSLLTRCQFHEADANVSAFILPRDFGFCFQSGARAGQVK